MPLSLRIFEERYRILVRELLSGGGVFGVLLIRRGEEVGGDAVPFEAGTTARIEEHEELPDGRFVLACRGIQRFRLVRMLDPRPYPYGEVRLMQDERVEATPALTAAIDDVRLRFPAYFGTALALTDQWSRPFALPANPHELVNRLGPWLKTDEAARQRLLELEDPVDRVRLLADLLDELSREAAEELAQRRKQRFRGLGAEN
jgi:hypothetical protein